MMIAPLDFNFSSKIRVWERDLEKFPGIDDELGRSLFTEIHKRAFLGSLLPEFWLFYADRIECFDLRPSFAYTPMNKMLLLSAIAGREGIECAALLCTAKSDAAGTPSGVCFIEWPDNRWWMGTQLHKKGGGLLSEHPIITRAVDGAPKPAHLGGWFSTARRLQIRLNIQSSDQQTVH